MIMANGTDLDRDALAELIVQIFGGSSAELLRSRSRTSRPRRVVAVIQQNNHSPHPIHPHTLPALQPVGGFMNAHHGRDAILSRHHRAVRHHAADLHHQPTGRQEQWRPSGIGAGTDQDLARRQLRTVGAKDDVHDPFHDARRYGIAHECGGSAVFASPSCAHLHNRPCHRSTARAAAACAAARVHRRPPLGNPRPQAGAHVTLRRNLLQFGVWSDKTGHPAVSSSPASRHPLPAAQQPLAHDAHVANGKELGRLTQSAQLPIAADGPAHQVRLNRSAQASLAHRRLQVLRRRVRLRHPPAQTLRRAHWRDRRWPGSSAVPA